MDLLEVANDLLPDRVAIVCERRDRDRLVILLAAGPAIFWERRMSEGRRQAGGESDRLEMHTGRHLAPRVHRRTEDPVLEPSFGQLGRQGQAVRAGADDGYVHGA